MNIVYGGSFNPPTLAHKKIMEILLNKFNPDHLFVVPVGKDYPKSSLIPFQHRFKMLQLLANNSKIFVSDIEKNQKYLGSYHTLKEIEKTFLVKDLYFVIGADNLITLDTWLNFEKLIKDYHFIVLNRNQQDIDLIIKTKFKDYQNKFITIDFDFDISSSKVRSDIDGFRNYLDETTYQYIKQHNLYRK